MRMRSSSCPLSHIEVQTRGMCVGRQNLASLALVGYRTVAPLTDRLVVRGAWASC